MPGVAGGRTGGRRLALWPALAALAVVLAGCDSTTTPDAQPTTVLRILMTDDWVTPPFVSAVRDFERSHPGVRLDIDRGPISHMIETVRSQVRTGTAPDIVQAHAFAAGAQGLAEQLDDLWEQKLDPGDFLPGAVEDVMWDGHYYGVPLDTNALFLLYNSEQFDASGVARPTGALTFEQFEQAARTLTDGSRKAMALPTSNWWTYGWIAANGGDVLEVGPQGAVQLRFDSPEVIGAMEFLARLVREDVAYAPGAADSHSGDALALFESGSASVLATGSWDLAVLRRQTGGDKYRAALLPTGGDPTKAGSAMGGSSLFVPRGSEHRALAFDFMKHLVEDRYAIRLAKEEGRLPVRTKVYDDPYFANDEAIRTVVLEQLKVAHPFLLEAFPEPSNIFAKAVDDVLRNGRDATEAFTEAQRLAQARVSPRGS